LAAKNSVRIRAVPPVQFDDIMEALRTSPLYALRDEPTSRGADDMALFV